MTDTPDKASGKSQGKYSERMTVIVVAVLLLIMWGFDQASLMTVVIVGGVTATLLVRLEIQRHLESLGRRGSEVHRRRKTQLGVRSVRAKALNSLPSPVLIIGQQHKIIFANSAASALLGRNIIGEDAYMFLRQPSLINVIERALAGEKVSKESERFTTNNDRSFDVTVASISSDGSDEKKQALVFFYEVTSLLRTERMRVDFVANASHELRTPLASLMGSIETLQGPARDDPEGQERFLSIMQREAERMARLIDDLLSLSRIEMARHQPPSAPVDIANLIDHVVNSVNPIAAKRNIGFNVVLPDGMPNVVADEDQIMQVMINLMGNAAKYADEDTTVHIECDNNPKRGTVDITIRDEGPGISAEHLARLTERFYRVDTARSRQMGGTGLGLAIVKHILLRHDSVLGIQSAVGEGTSFTFRLKAYQKKKDKKLTKTS